MITYNDENESVIEPEEGFFEDVDETEGTLLDRIKKLRTELKKTQEERKEYLDGWQRTKADYLNSKKRFEEERDDIIKRAEMRFVEKLLPLVDSFSMALDTTQGEENAWKTGLLQIHTQLQSLLRDLNVTEIEALGKPFNPYEHDALSSTQVDEAQKDIVVTVLQKGYKYKDTVLRPVKVIIGTT